MGTSAAPLKGNKSRFGGGSSGSSAPDSLFSQDTVELILAVSEGPCVGLANGAQSFLVAGTPLVDVANNPNIGNFDLRIHPGDNPGQIIKPNLGGFGTAVSVGVPLAYNVPVVRSGSHINLDFLGVRIVVNRLLNVGKKGEKEATADFKLEIKPHSSANWNNAYTGVLPPASETLSGNISRFTGQGKKPGQWLNPYYREIYTDATAPAAPVNANALWLRPQPHAYSAGAWSPIAGAVNNTPGGSTNSFWSWVEGTTQPRAHYGMVNGVAPTSANPNEFWVAPAGALGGTGVVSYVWNGSAWVNYMTWAVPPISSPGVISITGKTTSPMVKELLIPVAQLSEPYDVRVTRLSPTNTTTFFCDLTFESFTELSATPLQFDNLALAHLTIKASDQFTSIPDFEQEWYGRIIRIPTNYNPVTKIYTGLWDGTFKLGYTNCPAWIIYDLVTNDRYGMAAYVPIVMDTDTVYAFGKHCDQFGFTYNELITEARNLDEAIGYICGIAGGRFVDQGDGYASIVFDADDQPAVHLFTPENVVDGLITYSSTEIGSRKNYIVASFVNKAYNWIEDSRFDQDAGAIARFGRNPDHFVAVGCIDETEAVRRARLRLAIAQGENFICSIKTNRQGLYLKLYQVVLVADDASAHGITGRIFNILTPNSISLRDPVYFEAGFSYTIRFSVPTTSGMQIVSYGLTTTVGATKLLTLATPLVDQLPDQCPFSIESTSSIGVPKAFRVMNISEIDGEPDNVQLTLAEVNRTKWAYVSAPYIPTTNQTTSIRNRNVSPASNVLITGRLAADGTQEMVLTWGPSSSPLLKTYRVYQQINGGIVANIGETRELSFVIRKVLPASYVLSVVAVSLDGNESPPCSAPHEVVGVARTVLPIPALFLMDGETATTFRIKSPRFRWEASPDAFLQTYRVRIFQSGGATPLREVLTTLQHFDYTYEMNTADFTVASRTFVIEVRAVDTVGNDSAPLQLLVTNTQVSPPTVVTLIPNQFSLGISVAPTGFPKDWAGMVVYAGPTAGNTTIVYDGPNVTTSTPIQDTQRLYVRVAFYDDFDKSGLVFSSEVNAVGTGLDPGTVTYAALSAGAISGIGISVQPAINAGIATEALARQTADTTINSTITSLTTTVNANTASLSTEQTTRANADSALSASIVLVSATAGDYDVSQFWNFDTTVEGYTAVNASLTTPAASILNVTNSAAGAILRSPAALTVSGVNFTRIRMRVRRVAGSGWTGTVYYTTAGHSETTGFIKTIAGPTAAVGAWQVLEWDMSALTAGGTDWTISTITQLRFDLGSSATDIFEIDWIGVGRSGAPGKALVDNEALARATAVSVVSGQTATNTASIGGLSTSVTTLQSTTADLSGQFFGKWQVQLQVEFGGKKVFSGFGLAQAGGGGAVTSDFVVQADRFSVVPTYSNSVSYPIKPVFQVGTIGGVASVGIAGNMYVDGSIQATALSVNTLSAISANIGTVTAGLIQSSNGKMVIDLTNGSITISD